ncbi:MAG: amidohydrolase family protein [Dokdonella sp.]
MLRILRKASLVLVALLLLACAWLLIGLMRPLDTIPMFGLGNRPIAIINVSVVDVASGKTLGGRTVFIENKVISWMGPADEFEVPVAAQRVDGTGRFLVPGLWDSHVHTLEHSPRFHFPLLIAHGVTSIRNLGDGCSWSTDVGCVPDQVEWSTQGEGAGQLLPYSAVAASYHFEGSGDVVGSAERVGVLVNRGDTLIKLQLDDEVEPAVVHAIVVEARRLGIPVAGHLPASIDLLDPLFDGIASIEHGNELLDQCEMQATKAHSDGVVAGCATLLRTLAARRTAFVPTFVASTGQDALLGTNRRVEDERRQYSPQVIASVWTVYRSLHAAGMDADDRRLAQGRHQLAMELALLAHASGVPVLAGTDALDPFVQHGASLHDELEMLVEAGFSNADALRAATQVPAEFHGLSGKSGQVIAGARADLILLREDPLQRIGATRAIDAVLKDGIYFDAAELARLQAFAREQSNSHALNARLWWALLGG